jgi:hypothetical protein
VERTESGGESKRTPQPLRDLTDVLADCLVSKRLAKSRSTNDIGARAVDPVDRLADDVDLGRYLTLVSDVQQQPLFGREG